jgi:hypothetical protein
MAPSGVHRSRICRDHWTRALARSTLGDRRISAGIVSSWPSARASLDRRHAGRRRDDPRRWPLDHQPSGRDRRSSIRLANAVLGLGRDRHVGNFRIGANGCSPSPVALATTDVAQRSHVPCGDYRRRHYSARRTDRGHNGDDFEGGPLRSGARGNHESCRRSSGLVKQAVPCRGMTAPRGLGRPQHGSKRCCARIPERLSSRPTAGTGDRIQEMI